MAALCALLIATAAWPTPGRRAGLTIEAAGAVPKAGVCS